MSGKDYFKPNDWNAICDQCGAKYKASEILLQWDGARVCRQCIDPRHPQELQLPIPPPTIPSWVRPRVLSFETYTTERVIDGFVMDSQSMG